MAVQDVVFKSAEPQQKKVRERMAMKQQGVFSRRQRLELLQQDNHFEDPHKNLVLAKNLPRFDEDAACKQVKKSRKTKLTERWKKSFQPAVQEEERFLTMNLAHIAEDLLTSSYFTAEAKKSRFPAVSLCSVCNFPCNMKCVTCLERFCSKRCLEIHKDTRCMKRVL